MLKKLARALSSGAIGLSLVLSQQAMPATPAFAQTDAPIPPVPAEQPPLPVLAPDAAPDAQPIPPVPEPTAIEPLPAPEQAVRDILEKGRAILYPGHILTPTEKTGPQPPFGHTAAEASQAQTSITGTVIVSETGLPMSFVWVVAYTSKTAFSGGTTDRQGNFSVYVNDPGDYTIRIDPSQVYPYDLAGEWYDGQALSDTATLISTTVGSPSLSISLIRGSQITGTVVASDTGAPLAGMTLAVYDANGTFLHSVLSDDAGHYSTGGLRSGSYTVCAYAYLEVAAATRRRYPGGCYDNQPNPKSATPLSVTAPSALPNITVAVPFAAQITGVVTAAETGLPLAGVEVYVYGKNGITGNYSTTNSGGQYVVDGLSAGPHILYFSTRYGTAASRRYIGEYYDGKQTADTADVITLTASATLSNVNASLDLGSTITGLVTAEDTGAPLGEVAVDIFSPGGNQLNSTRTNGRGQYVVGNLPKGPYKIFFSTRDLPSFGNAPKYFGEYYDNKPSLSTADIITLTAAVTLSNVNAALGLGGRITGVVSSLDTRTPISDVRVTAINTYGDPFKFVTTNGLGEYAIGGLSTGAYRIYFSPRSGPGQTGVPLYYGQYYSNTFTFNTATPVSVTINQTVGNINARLDRGGQITGVVTGQDTGRGLERVWVNISRKYMAYDPYADSFGVSTFTDANGHYTVTTPAGQFQASFLPYYHLAPYCGQHYNQRSTYPYADPIWVTPNQVTANINGVLDRTSRISGTVISAQTGAPLERVYVRLLPLDWLNSNTSYGTSTSVTDAQGRYDFNPICAGQYKLSFDTTYGPTQTVLYASGYYSGAQTFNAGDTIDLTPGSMLTLNTALTQMGQITGTVLAADTGLRVSNSYVSAFDLDGKRVRTESVGASGSYVLNLVPGSYKLYADTSSGSNSYASEYYSSTASFGEAITLGVAAKQVLGNINFELEQGGDITGIITDEDTGKGIPYAKVLIYEVSNPNYSITETYTDYDGEYATRSRLRTGNYKAQVRVYTGDYLSRYYGNSINFGSASAISVTSGMTTTNINVSLLSIRSPKLITRLHMPIAMRAAPEAVQIAATPIVISTATAIKTAVPTATKSVP